MKAVRFDRYGGLDVLRVDDVPIPEPAQGEVLVNVKAASINPGEAKIREGLLHARWPATFPSGEGSDFAGIVTKIGSAGFNPAREGRDQRSEAQGFSLGGEVIGFTNRRASHTEYVIAEPQKLPSENSVETVQ